MGIRYNHFLISNSYKMTTINENCLHHYPYNDQTLTRKSDEDLIVTGNHDSLADIDPDLGLHLIQITNVPIIILQSLIQLLLTRITFQYWL